ncbi:hypothetical protein [Roseibium alexandrii]|uniref:Uncharacterized protein n=1 Tax=Roseibium alexandrii (strain DSM 17067 / NCIMB 14079 / DFL-11) TaxID=244592 RepID=A0A5E8GUF3_ROSAD|nr:hypothetical protein [Roseibium alexandrii]EEE43566.1 hypothetical protein SADFL11_852 [Roseibium alexandrii DFL-11]
MRFYWLIVQDEYNAPWEITFGDYDKETVKEELLDITSGFNGPYDARIVTAPDFTQGWIDKKLIAMNG